jgi:hypothetical protein
MRTGPNQTRWDVSRKRFQRIGDFSSTQGEFAERLAAEHYGFTLPSAEHEVYDGIDRDNDTQYEVKSSAVEIDGRDKRRYVPVEGRYIIFEQQLQRHEKRQRRDGATSWFVFVLFGDGNDVLDRRRMYPSTLRRIINEQGYEPGTGHRSGRRYKIPVSEIFPYVDDD